MTVAIIGIGLIGGSLSLALKQKGIAEKIIAVEANPIHAEKALLLGLADEIVSLDKAIDEAQLIVMSIPVDAVEAMLPYILDRINHHVVMDVGSIKKGIIDTIKNHPKRSRFVATHPMWGTEYSGPEAAVTGAFITKATVICNRDESDVDALHQVESLYKALGMHIINMTAEDHDVHVAYISHISHITSFALANTVLEKEKEEKAIFELASSGFESTVRLAKSNSAMWVPVLIQNKENVLDVLNEHISQLRKFKACLEKENAALLHDLIQKANGIRKIIR
jgi:prephenate dehydrogenase